MVLHLRAPKGKVSVEVMLNRAKYFDRTGKVNDHTIYLSGNLGKNALEFAMCLSAKATGGRVYTMGHSCFFAMLPRKEDARRHPVAVEHIRFSSVPIDADSHIAL